MSLKLEFKNNSTHVFNIKNDDKTLIKCHCSGKIKDNYFISKFDFNINNNTLSNIYFHKIINPSNVVNQNYIETYSDIIEQSFEQIVYLHLCNILQNNVIINNSTISITGSTDIDYFVMHLTFKVLENTDNRENISSMKLEFNAITDNKINITDLNTTNENHNNSNESISKTFSSFKHNKKNIKEKYDILKLTNWSIILSYVIELLNKDKKKKNPKI